MGSGQLVQQRQSDHHCSPMLAVQKGLKGSYNDEVVVGGQYEVLRDLVVGTTLIYRWLGRAIEDTYDQAHPDDGPTIVVNPPGATRTYQAVQFTANKRFARRWFLASSYTLVAAARQLRGPIRCGQ
jgi:hypothetical protein